MSRLKKMLQLVFLSLLIFPLVLLVALYFMQEKLLFVGASMNLKVPDRLAVNRGYEVLKFKTPEGENLVGWFLKASRESPSIEQAPVVFFLGGNADQVFYYLDFEKHFPGYHLVAVCYRGYGNSGGSPTYKALSEDALRIYDEILKRPDVAGSGHFVFARSIGTGLGVELASKREISNLLLISPYGSMTEVASHHYPILPMSLVLKHPFPAIDYASNVQARTLVIAARQDQVIPINFSRGLFEAIPAQKEILELPHANHNNIFEFSEVFEKIEDFFHLQRSTRNHPK